MQPMRTLTDAATGVNTHIYYDTDPINPRTDYDHVGTMACWHHSYSLGDEQPCCGIEEWMAGQIVGALPFTAPELDFAYAVQNWMQGYQTDGFSEENLERNAQAFLRRMWAKLFISLPLSLYDHGGLRLSTGRPSCPWDSGYVGLIYISRADAASEWPGTPAEVEAAALRCLEAEVQEYDQYLRGEVYGVRVEMPGGLDGESCWGLFGDKYAREFAEGVHQEAVKTAHREAARVSEWAARDVMTVGA